MNSLNDCSLARLVARANELQLLADHRFVDRFLYLDVGGHRYVFDGPMGRTFLLGLIAGHERTRSLTTTARAA